MSEQVEKYHDCWDGKYQFGVDEEGIVERTLKIRFNNTAGKIEYQLMEEWFCMNDTDMSNCDYEYFDVKDANAARNIFQHYKMTVINPTLKVSDLDDTWVPLAKWERKP